MKNIDWKSRISNRAFWIALVSAILLFTQFILNLCGIQDNVEGLDTQLVNLINAIFTVLTVFGIIIDPTTKGFKDSDAKQEAPDMPDQEDEQNPISHSR